MEHTYRIHSLNQDRPQRQAAQERASGRRIEVAAGKATSVAAVPGTVVSCLEGRLWLTQEGHWRDYILVPGATYVSLDRGTIVLTTTDEASAASLSRIELAPEDRANDARLQISAEAIGRIEREARRARAQEIARWFEVLGKALTEAWGRIASRRAPRQG